VENGSFHGSSNPSSQNKGSDMSSLTKDPRGWSKYWTCCFTSADGRQLKRSTRETDKRRARIICECWERAESLGKDGLLTSEVQLARVIEQSFERLNGKKVHHITVREWLERWLKNEEGAVAETTLQKYKQVLGGFLQFLGTRAEVRLDAVVTDDFLGYRDQLLEGGRTPRTVNITIRKILTRPFVAAVNEGKLDRNPIASIRHLHDISVEKGVFTPDQITKLLEVADSDWRGLTLAGYYTGARLGDLARLTWAAINLDERSITFVQKKTGAKIKVPIHSQFLDYLLGRSVPNDGRKPVFPKLYHLRGSGKTGLSSSFRRLMDRAGIDAGIARQKTGDAGRNVSSLSFHSLRHSFTSALANAGVPADVRQKLTGHADAKSHATYSHHELETIRGAVEKIAALPKKTV
jgi:integrase